MTYSIDINTIRRIFKRFAEEYGYLWTSRLGPNGDWNSCELIWLEDLQKFSLSEISKAVKNALIIYDKNPPTKGQLIKLCLKASGLPNEFEVADSLRNKNFNHPIIKILYDKIGSWKLSNGKEDEINRLIKEFYDDAICEFRSNPSESWKQLELHNTKPKQLSSYEKVPKVQERKEFKERLTEYQQKIEEAKLNVQGNTYREFDRNKVNPRHCDFDKKIYEDYKNYLLSIPESNTLILSVEYIYDRRCFLNQQHQSSLLAEAGYVPINRRDNVDYKKSQRNQNKSYKNWMND